MEQADSLLGLKGCSQDVGQAGFSSGDSIGKESASKLSQDDRGRIPFPVAVFWLKATLRSTRGCGSPPCGPLHRLLLQALQGHCLLPSAKT